MLRIAALLPIFFICLIVLPDSLMAQKSLFHENIDLDYRKGVELFEKEKYGAAQEYFKRAVEKYDDHSMLRGYAEYYSALCAIKLQNEDAEYLMVNFIESHPANTKTDEARFYLGRHHYRDNSFSDASRWFASARPEMLPAEIRDEYYFSMGYSFFMTGEFDRASTAFIEVMNGTSGYADAATYYYSHIAYTENNFQTALAGFTELRDDTEFSELASYYIIQIYYLQRRFEEVIRYGPELLETATERRVPEIARIIGESYYRQGNYEQSVDYLEIYMDKSEEVSRDDRYQIGFAYYRTGRYEKAAEMFEGVSGPDDELQQNALYHLADCYIELGEKDKARVAFESAARMEHDQRIREEALFNHSVLTYELAHMPFNEAIDGFNEFIELYPQSDRIDEAYNYLVMAYMNTNNYKQALVSLERISDKTSDIEEAYQRVAYFRGLELFNDLNFSEAVEMFDLSLQYSQYDPSIAAQSYYWKGEAYYRLENFDNATNNYSRFLLSPGAFELDEYKTAHYNMGYAYFEKKEYSDAQSWFRRYLNFDEVTGTRRYADALNRTGDSYFSMSRYSDALGYYRRAADAGKIDTDYALFQMAVCEGLLDREENKIDILYTLVQEHPGSPYKPDALYELGRTYLDIQSPDQAMEYYNRVFEEFPESRLAERSLLQIGLIHYNRDRYEEALATYKRVIDEYPGTSEARSALTGLRNIYIDIDDVDSYFEYADQLGDFADMTASEKDSLTYVSAENVYMSGDCESATERLENYLDEFGNGIFTVNAHFYLADCYHMKGEYEKALESYNYVTENPRSEFAEQAHEGAASIYFDKENWQPALENFEKLEELSRNKGNLKIARKGQMRCHFELGNYSEAAGSADRVLAMEDVPAEIVREAKYIGAKSYLALDELDEAADRFSDISGEVSSREGAESKYRVAEIYFRKGEYERAKEEVNDFISMSTPHHYWMANSFILLADVYMEEGDYFQARHTLKSVIDNYDVPDDGIIDRAEERLETIEERENM